MYTSNEYTRINQQPSKFLNLIKDIGVMIYEAMTSQCERSVVQILVVRVDIGVMIYEAMTSQWRGQWFRSWLSEWI